MGRVAALRDRLDRCMLKGHQNKHSVQAGRVSSVLLKQYLPSFYGNGLINNNEQGSQISFFFFLKSRCRYISMMMWISK